MMPYHTHASFTSYRIISPYIFCIIYLILCLQKIALSHMIQHSHQICFTARIMYHMLYPHVCVRSYPHLMFTRHREFRWPGFAPRRRQQYLPHRCSATALVALLSLWSGRIRQGRCWRERRPQKQKEQEKSTKKKRIGYWANFPSECLFVYM